MPQQGMARLNFGYLFVVAWVFAASAADLRATKHAKPGPEWLLQLEHIPKQPRSGQTVQIQAEVRVGITNVELLYQVVEPGAYIELGDSAFRNNWKPIQMQPVASAADKSTFRVELPAALQKHRRLVRYRLKVLDSAGKEHFGPDLTDLPPNRAYFVYDGIPSWTGAIDPRGGNEKLTAPYTFSPEVMQRVQAYQLLGKRRSIENATWREQSFGKEYKYTGTLVVDGEVFDHVGYRARGGVWRYAMGKNMWKFYLPGDHSLQAKDDFGRPYPAPWNKINLRACIQQGDYGHRGEQGMFESVGFRLFNLAGVPAPNTHWIQLRIIDEATENPPDQYRGDFWGFYLAIENEDGRFLKAHHLPSGNLFKMEGGGGLLQHHATGAVTNLSDLFGFMSAYSRPNLPDSWWETHFDLTNYYSYRAICECIHHYDVGMGKNYDYYHQPETGRWQIIPWDIDLTWANNMFGDGEDPFKRRVLSRPAFRLEYQNRLREIRDLLFNPEQTGQMIDEYASVISDKSGAPALAEADRRKWDYHPIMGMGMKAGQGLFYQAADTGDFAGMVRLMKNYVRTRGAWVDSVLLNDSSIPETPKLSACGPAGFPADQLRFTVSRYKGSNPFAAVKWRLAEISAASTLPTGSGPVQGLREIRALWESAELPDATAPVAIPAAIAKSGHRYRVRARMKDATGRWSHWSPPAEFSAQ
ncbi:MAG TPA: CotH kinase family protein [Verrucomicrobiae bacterium]|nr:CotH kinase family protein [Verrucomicrobiae bacterium]